MHSSWLLVCIVLAAASLCAQKLGVGRAASPDEVKAWDIGISPDGRELPPGAGTSIEGKEVYDRRCKRCHGDAGKGGDETALVGGLGSLATPRPLKTVGSYWPKATTLFDYVRRAMPYKNPGSLSDAQVYAVTAYILNLNGIVGASDAMNAQTLPKVKMPNAGGFIPDSRPDTGAGKKKK
ncbi:MAG: cytochrome c [Acidobacteria bacterium]|nr:cytochrome c [Acidobacteriota bacterium]